MIEIAIPGFGQVRLQHLVSDYNGTLALDGRLLPGVADAVRALSTRLSIHVVTADTFGLAAAELVGLPVRLHITPVDSQDLAKLAYVQALGPDTVVAMGNGRNDRHMLKVAAVGIALSQREGLATETLLNADLVLPGVLDAFELLAHPKRLTATLRS